MDYTIFLLPLAVSFAVASSFLVLLILLGRKKIFSNIRIGKRHLHKTEVSRFGGAALILTVVLMIFFNERLYLNMSLLAILMASGLILVFGVIDDIRQLSWKTQLFFQIIVVMIVYFAGVRLEYITNPFGGIIVFNSYFWGFAGMILSSVWIFSLMNVLNWVDGIDGVSSGVSIIGSLTIFILSLRPEVNQPAVSIISMIFLGALAALLFFNFYPAKILAGTSGSMFMGFMLGVVAIFAGAKIATTMLVMAVPVIDAIWVMGERLRDGKSVFLPDRRHLHFRLLEIGWSPRKICFFYYGITAIVAFVALNTRAFEKVAAFFLVTIFMFLLYRVINTKTISTS